MSVWLPHGLNRCQHRGMQPFAEDTLMVRLGITVEKTTSEAIVLRMPISGNTQIHGIVHGGASAALAETAASVAAYHHAVTLNTEDGQARLPVCTDLTIQHVRPGSGNYLTATATPIHLGRTRTVHRVEVHNDAGKLTSSATVANQLVQDASRPN